MFAKINRDFSDLRIIGIKDEGDTIEVPYILKIQSDKFHSEAIEFKLINQVKNGSSLGYYYTFEFPDPQLINFIDLDFEKINYDWFVELEGSQDQREWFKIVENSRILSIENNFTSYSYSALTFKEVEFKYFRLFIPSSKNPYLKKASISKNIVVMGEYIIPEILSQTVIENHDLRQTEIMIDLKWSSPVSYLKLNVINSFDYHRQIIFQHTTDSINNKTGWHYVYSTVHNSTLTSFDNGEFRFPNTIMKNIKIVIKNGDNEFLDYEITTIRGDVHQLVGRFIEPANYYLLYGNKGAYVPNYDIGRFEANIPSNLVLIAIGDEVLISKPSILDDESLFKNSIWLWTILVLIIGILGWFSLKMLKEK